LGGLSTFALFHVLVDNSVTITAAMIPRMVWERGYCEDSENLLGFEIRNGESGEKCEQSEKFRFFRPFLIDLRTLCPYRENQNRIAEIVVKTMPYHATI